MLRTVKDACEVHPSTLEYQVAGGVESLAQVLNAKDEGKDFFEKSYLTRGMEELLTEGLLRLSGQTDQAVFELAQAMGGGKTHLMSALGLLAKYPSQRSQILPTDVLTRLDGQVAHVAVFDGRESPDHYLWGEIAHQLGAGSAMRPFWQNGPKAPGKEHWKEIIGDRATLILFDELPPYFLEARTVPVGKGSMVDVLTRALSNLFAAALELPRCCVVLANLSDSYREQVKEVRKLVADVQREASRQAKKITPVSLEGSEIYSILRKRLLANLPTEEDIDEVAEAYAAQVKLAEDSGYLTARSLEQVADEVRATYPFHPSFKHLVALFKDNPDFRETRGLLQFAARVIRSVWQRQQNDVFLIGTQHLNLNDSQVMNEVTDINRALRPAIAQDIADNGNAHAEEIDANLNSDAASQVACMLLSASLSLAVKGHMGLRREEVIEYLAAPNRKPEEFAQAFDRLRKTAWYLHAEGELFYFKDTENLTKRIQREAQGLPKAKVDKALRTRLEGELEAQSKEAYQEVLVMPEINEIRLNSHRILVVVPPDNSVLPEDIHRFYRSVSEKNNLLVLSGNDSYG
jgi:predicted AAA+ superfamily ATPase